MNDQIRARQVRVIDEEGEQLGIMSPRDALQEAEQRGYDLVEVAPKANPPVCRIMDYGKYRYEQKRRARESRKHQHTVTAKEIRFRPKIDKHDLENKVTHVREFLGEGFKVKVTVMFRGREVTHAEIGEQILHRLQQELSELSNIEKLPKLEGYSMTMILTPRK